MALPDFGLPPREPSRPELVPPRRRGRWGRITVWVGGMLLALMVIVGVAVVAVLRSASFHNYVSQRGADEG